MLIYIQKSTFRRFVSTSVLCVLCSKTFLKIKQCNLILYFLKHLFVTHPGCSFLTFFLPWHDPWATLIFSQITSTFPPLIPTDTSPRFNIRYNLLSKSKKPSAWALHSHRSTQVSRNRAGLRQLCRFTNHLNGCFSSTITNEAYFTFAVVLYSVESEHQCNSLHLNVPVNNRKGQAAAPCFRKEGYRYPAKAKNNCRIVPVIEKGCGGTEKNRGFFLVSDFSSVCLSYTNMSRKKDLEENCYRERKTSQNVVTHNVLFCWNLELIRFYWAWRPKMPEDTVLQTASQQGIELGIVCRENQMSQYFCKYLEINIATYDF